MLIQSVSDPTGLPCDSLLSSQCDCCVWGVSGKLLWTQWCSSCVPVWDFYSHLEGSSSEVMFPNFSLQVSAHFPAPTATGPSPTAPIYGLICRPTPRWRSTSVACALAPSAACHCCRNTAPRGAAPLRCETAWREAEGTHSELRRVCSHGEEVFTSPVALLRTYKATKSMKWPALWDLDGIKPHYGSDFTSLFFTIKKTADKLIFFSF